MPIDIEILREFLSYDHSSGKMFWKKKTNVRSPAVAGKEAGGRHTEGYITLSIKNANILAHRAAWAMFYGEHPKNLIDHINGDKTDNRIENLRDVDRRGNAQNVRNAPVSNKSSGLLGVTYHKQNRNWVATIHSPKTSKTHIGSFASKEEAHAAYIEAKRRLHDGCTI